MLADLKAPLDFDFLSIDVDGADYHIWKSCHNHYTPRVVCIEFNPTIPNDVVFIQEPDCSIHKGSSLLALIELGKDMGYNLVVTTTFNAIFVHESITSSLPVINNSIDVLHSSSMVTEIFQTYEGELVLCGPKKLIWHRIPINPQKIQVLSKKDRKFPFSPVVYDEIQKIYTAKENVKRYFKLYTNKSADMSEIEPMIISYMQSFQPLLVYQHLEEDIYKVLADYIGIVDFITGGVFTGQRLDFRSKEERNLARRVCETGITLYIKVLNYTVRLH
jgi:hypothetical protein